MLPTYLDSHFLLSIDNSYQSDLDRGIIPENLKRELNDNGIQISGNIVTVKKTGNRWQIDGTSGIYHIRKEMNRLKVYATSGKGKIFTTMVLLVGIVGQYMGGSLSDRYRKTRLYLLFNSLSLPFMIMIGLASGMPLILVGALFALFHFCGQPVENNLIAQYTPSRLRSSSYGLKFVFTFGIGSFASAFSGYIGENYGLNSVFLALGVVIILMLMILVFLNLVAKEESVQI